MGRGRCTVRMEMEMGGGALLDLLGGMHLAQTAALVR